MDPGTDHIPEARAGETTVVVVAKGPSGVPSVPFGFLGFSGASRGFLGLAGARDRVQLSFVLVGACVQ